jgi:hypothetical protein
VLHRGVLKCPSHYGIRNANRWRMLSHTSRNSVGVLAMWRMPTSRVRTLTKQGGQCQRPAHVTERKLAYAEAISSYGSHPRRGTNQATLFPVVLDAFVSADHVCRVIDAFVEKLVMSELGFERAQAAETGRPGYDPRDLLKLYLLLSVGSPRSCGPSAPAVVRLHPASTSLQPYSSGRH